MAKSPSRGQRSARRRPSRTRGGDTARIKLLRKSFSKANTVQRYVILRDIGKHRTAKEQELYKRLQRAVSRSSKSYIQNPAAPAAKYRIKRISDVQMRRVEELLKKYSQDGTMIPREEKLDSAYWGVFYRLRRLRARGAARSRTLLSRIAA